MIEQTYPVAEIFTSINGEGTRAGELALFIRLCGCNLDCGYCDTKWVNREDVSYTAYTASQLAEIVRKSGIKNVTLTGGEPLMAAHAAKLLYVIAQENPGADLEVETNGSIPLKPYMEIPRVRFTMDYKLAGSGMEACMRMENLSLLRPEDTAKFVVSDAADLKRAYEVIEQYDLVRRCSVYISPVFGRIDPADIVKYMKMRRMNGVRLQLQLHKLIWDPETRGV